MSDGGNRQWQSRCAAALLIGLPILVLFWPVLSADRSLAMRDAAHFYHPLLKWTTEQWHRDGPPLWNPYENTGRPQLADGSSALFYPGRLLLAAPVDFTIRYNLYVIGHVALAALGAYLLARHWQTSRAAASSGAIAYACGGVVIFLHCNVVFLVGAAWLPFAFWAIDCLLIGRSWGAVLGLAVVLALMVLGGDPQTAYHVVVIGALYGLISARAEDQSSTRLAAIAVRAGRNLGWIAMAAAIGGALAAVQVLPSWEAAAESERAYYDRPRTVYEAAAILGASDPSHESRWEEVAVGILGQPPPTTHHERLYDFSLAPWRLIECLWPNVGGRMFPTHCRWLSLIPAEGRIWTPSLYFGLVPFVLALAQWRLFRASPSHAWLSWLLLLFTIGSFGWYGLGWLAREAYASALSGDPNRVPIGSPVGGLYWLMVTVLPGYVSFRYPAKLLVVAALAASQLAARGFDQALVARPARVIAWVKVVVVTSVLLLLVSWSAFAWLRHFAPDYEFGRRISQFLTAQRDLAMGPLDWTGCQRDICLGFLQTALVGLAAHWLLTTGRAPKWRPLGLAMLIVADVLLANYWLISTAPADIWRQAPAAAAAIGADGADPAPRVYRASLWRWRPATFAHSSSRNRLVELAEWERDTLFPKYGLLWGVSLVESYGSLNSADYQSLLLVAKQHGPDLPTTSNHELPHPAVLHMLSTQYVVVPAQWQLNEADEPAWAQRVSQTEPNALPPGAALWRVAAPLPRAWIVHQVERMPPLRSRRLAVLDEQTRDVLFPKSPANDFREPRDFRRLAVVESELPLAISAASAADCQEECRIVEGRLDSLVIDAKLCAAGLLVVSDRVAPGWTARVETNGQVRSIPVLRTNRVCRGLALPEGNHRVTLSYQPKSFLAGAWISGIFWVAMLLFGGWSLGATFGLRAGGCRR